MHSPSDAQWSEPNSPTRPWGTESWTPATENQPIATDTEPGWDPPQNPCANPAGSVSSQFATKSSTSAFPPARRGLGTRGWIAIIAVAVLLAGALGAGITKAFGSSTSTTPRQISKPARSTAPANTTTESTTAVLAKVLPAVVEITAHAEVPVQGYPFGGGFLGGFGGGFGGYGGYGPYGSAPMEESVVDEGTGMIITSHGEVITNNHVIADAKSISVKVPGHSGTYSATVVGTDPTDDVALLQLHGISNLPTVTFGHFSHVVVGESVLAIGNALGLGGSPTVTSGIVSALGRTVSASDPVTGLNETLTNMIQTDAPINPGNSGGPLVNMKGHVIGMDTAAATSAGAGNGSAQDIGFAIPVNRIEHLLPLLQKGGTIGGTNPSSSVAPTTA